MTGKKLYLVVQAALWVLIVALLSGAAVRICREGLARRALDPLAPVYTPEAVAEAFERLAPLLYLSAGMAAAGLLLGVGGEGAFGGTRTPGTRKGPAVDVNDVPGHNGGRARGAVRLALLVAAAACILLGIFGGGARNVFVKAAAICTECIGLG